ncbi:transcriptional regulator medA [Aspergillus undulatus]|uniref:transcriptional regulator medA n=1 Tax=Aspergillus undulatus TaxID=1810928 RepID=UPI003CCCE8A1
MSAFHKSQQAAVLDCDSAQSLQDGASYSAYGQPAYMSTPLAPSPVTDHISQMSDCVPYMAKQEYASSYEDEMSPMITAESRQLPEVISYSPQRGSEGTRVFVQIQSPYDLHTTPYATLYIMFGTKKCECNPHFLGFQDSFFQYALSVDTPPFMSTGTPSLAVPLQVAFGNPNDCSGATLQVGIYTYEHAGQQSPSDESRKRRFSSDALSRSVKRTSTLPVQVKEESSGYAAPYSSYLQPLPSMNAYAASYHADASPRINASQYTHVSTNSQPSIRAPSPMAGPSPMAPSSWNSSFLSVNPEQRSTGYPVGHGLPQPSSPARLSNPTLIRTSTLQQSSGVVQPTQSFNPYAMYPAKAILKMNGDLDTMAENWTPEERIAKRRLVQFTRMQSGSTINADFTPVTPEERAPNSICISCIYWDGKDECFVTSVDTIYLLESLVGVRFTVEEKNRIRRNLEGFRPLTVSKSKANSEDFFKTIMGFPAPKPRNIEKDVKVFPWKILSHALKKIIGKYSASYSSTAGALPTPIGSNYPSMGPASDSGTEGQNVASPQSISEGTPSSSYHPSIAAPVYNPPTEADGPIRTILPAVSQPYPTMTAPYSYTTVCNQGQLAPAAPVTRAWEFSPHAAPSAPSTIEQTPGSYHYMPPMTYALPGHPQGH